MWRVLGVLGGCALASSEPPDLVRAAQAEELGAVAWTRGIDAAQPRWNNPVMRVLEPSGQTRARFAGPYAEAAPADYLSSSLGPTSPRWLGDLALDLIGASRADTATSSMACFWTGEAHLGGRDGVLAARTGWQDGREVVEVTFDPARAGARDLARHAAAAGLRPESKGTLSPTPGDDRHALRRSPFVSIPMTAGQATRANHLVAEGRDPTGLFSPRQLAAAGGAPATLGQGDLGGTFQEPARVPR